MLYFKRYRGLLLAIIVLAGVFFFRLNRADVMNDSATYLYRSWGYVDYMSSKLQTTPVQWFAALPWWAHLSFHDAPPLAFIINFFALAMSGGSPLAARAVNAAFGIIMGAVLWQFVARRASERYAWLALALFVGITPLISIQRTTLLESSMTLWLVLGFLAVIKTEKTPRAWYLAAICFGAACMTKYTAIFFLLGPLAWIVLRARHLAKEKNFWLSVALFFFILSPVIIYNGAMWRAVGHPDLQISSALHLNTAKDWSDITRTVGGGGGLQTVVRSALPLLFPSMWLAIIAAGAYVTMRARRTQDSTHIMSIGACIGGFAGLFVIGAAYRYAAPLFVGVTVLMCVALIDFFHFTGVAWWKKIIPPLVMLCALGGIIETVVINYSYTDPRGIFSTDAGRESNDGWQELGTLLSTYLTPRSPQVFTNAWRYFTPGHALNDEFTRIQKPSGDKPFHGLIIYDTRVSWFPRLWYFERWNIYRHFTVLSLFEYRLLLKQDNGNTFAQKFSSDEVTFIKSLTPATGGFEGDYAGETKAADVLTGVMESWHVPEKTVHGPDGVARFEIYGDLAKQ